MAELVNTFSWSKSRDEKFRTCPRQYFFHYYGSWGGWDPAADERTRTLYILKQLKNRWMWAGEKTHDCIRKALLNLRRGIEPMSEKEAVDTTLDVMRREYLGSRRKDYWKNPKTCGFLEHEYEWNLPDKAWKEAADHVVNCLRTFYRSSAYRMIRGTPGSQWLEVEEFSTFALNGTPVHVVLDFSCRRGEEILIYDWKTGRSAPERNELQLACYTFYAVEKWKVEPAKVVTVNFNLASGREARFLLDAADLAAIRNHILGSVRDMKLLLDDPDRNTAREERFPFTENEKECRFCNFRKVCPRWS